MNYEDIQFEQLESSVEHWIASDKSDALEVLGEDVVFAVVEALDYE